MEKPQVGPHRGPTWGFVYCCDLRRYSSSRKWAMFWMAAAAFRIVGTGNLVNAGMFLGLIFLL